MTADNCQVSPFFGVQQMPMAVEDPGSSGHSSFGTLLQPRVVSDRSWPITDTRYQSGSSNPAMSDSIGVV